MAVQGTPLIVPYQQGTPARIASFPYGNLVTPYIASTPSRILANVISRFPVPPVAWGFMIAVNFQPAYSKISNVVAGAVYPESSYLEPTIGQIWPR